MTQRGGRDMNKESYLVTGPKSLNTNICVETIVPGSKSITNRALLLAAMAEGTSVIKGCLTSDDAMHFLECLKDLGFPVKEEREDGLGSTVTITGFGGKIPNKKAEIYVGSAGTAARFLVAMLAFSDGEYVVNSSEQMKKRPMEPLIEALRAAGARVECPEKEGHFPLKIKGPENPAMIPDHFSVNIDQSSQFLSALLIAVGTLEKPARIQVVGSHGLSYVEMTAEMMKQFGVTVGHETADGRIQYVFPGKGQYQALDYEVEPDMSAAAYFYGLAAVLGARVTVKGVTDHMLQGDVEFLRLLEKMGCKIGTSVDGTVAVTGPEQGALKGGFTVDMSAFSDQALTLAAIAPFADGPVTITGIGHIRLQECDRVEAIVHNLRELGIRTEAEENQVTIYPGQVHGGTVETYEDHRVAMSFALTGLRTEGVRILNPGCCRKTFAEYFQVLEQVLLKLSGEE